MCIHDMNWVPYSRKKGNCQFASALGKWNSGIGGDCRHISHQYTSRKDYLWEFRMSQEEIGCSSSGFGPITTAGCMFWRVLHHASNLWGSMQVIQVFAPSPLNHLPVSRWISKVQSADSWSFLQSPSAGWKLMESWSWDIGGPQVLFLLRCVLFKVF